MAEDSSGLLGTRLHPRDSAGLTYVYPVVSRRAGGVSIGINLNTNNACNWRCVYCQVPNLRRGSAPLADVSVLERELMAFLDEAIDGDFLVRRVPEGARRLTDVAISGNGEPTSCPNFPEVVELIARVLDRKNLRDSVQIRLITNGSLVGRASVQAGLATLGHAAGEVWFKLDAATTEGMRRINDVALTPVAVERKLGRCAHLCATRVQTCLFRYDACGPTAAELDAYCTLLARLGPRLLRGVMLYGIARQPMQPEAPRLSPMPEAEMEAIADRLREIGLTVTVSP